MKSKPLNQLFSISSEFTRFVIFALLGGKYDILYSFLDQAEKTAKDPFGDESRIRQAGLYVDKDNQSINIRIKRGSTILKILLPRDNYDKAFYSYRDLKEYD